jgi:hypothetical protein
LRGQVAGYSLQEPLLLVLEDSHPLLCLPLLALAADSLQQQQQQHHHQQQEVMGRGSR